MRRLLTAALVCLLACCASEGRIDPATMDDATFDREFERRFQYAPAHAAPQEVSDPQAGQVADAEYLMAFPDHDRAYAPAARAEATRLASVLRADAGSLSHEQFVLRVAEIAALADNAHTSIDENAWRKNTPRLPLRTYLFADGLHVVWAAAGQADLLGARIDTIDGRAIEEVQRALRRYAGGTDAWRVRALAAVFESPALLHAAGLAMQASSLTLKGVKANGEPYERRIAAERRDRAAWVSSSSRLLFPARPDGPMKSWLQDDADLPVYLRRRAQLLALDDLPGGGLYVGIATNDDTDERPLRDFLDEVIAKVRGERPRYVVVDMRMNGGGDLTKSYDFARALPGAARGAPIYVVTSSWTFSAAIHTVATLKQAGGGQVVIVGEPVGDRLDFWAEGGTFELPNAFVRVHYAAGRHVYNGPCADPTQCVWLALRYPVRVTSLQPDVAAPLTFAAYRAKRDPALEAIAQRERLRGSPQHSAGLQASASAQDAGVRR
jgi:hypothetical protein